MATPTRFWYLLESLHPHKHCESARGSIYLFVCLCVGCRNVQLYSCSRLWVLYPLWNFAKCCKISFQFLLAPAPFGIQRSIRSSPVDSLFPSPPPHIVLPGGKGRGKKVTHNLCWITWNKTELVHLPFCWFIINKVISTKQDLRIAGLILLIASDLFFIGHEKNNCRQAEVYLKKLYFQWFLHVIKTSINTL